MGSDDTDLELRTLPEESLDELYELAPCGYLSIWPDGTVARVNHTLASWVGRSRHELVGKVRFPDLLTVGGQVYYETHVAPLLFMQGSVEQIAIDLRCVGRVASVLMSAVQKYDPKSGRTAYTRITLFDVSERRRYERELLHERRRAEQEAQARAEFAAMVSHEIRTPLSAIISVAELLEQSHPPEAQQRLVTLLSSSTHNLLCLVNDVLDYSKLESGKLTLHEQPVDLPSAMLELADLQRPRIDAQQVGLDVLVDERIPRWVYCDRVKLGQIITNLVGNAIKFTPQGFINVSAMVTELLPELVSVRFEVADTGVGIAPKLLSHVFERFTQSEQELQERRGTGLGLAISQKLVQLLGGQLVASSTEGHGSRFSFVLRLRRVAPDCA